MKTPEYLKVESDHARREAAFTCAVAQARMSLSIQIPNVIEMSSPTTRLLTALLHGPGPYLRIFPYILRPSANPGFGCSNLIYLHSTM